MYTMYTIHTLYCTCTYRYICTCTIRTRKHKIQMLYIRADTRSTNFLLELFVLREPKKKKKKF